MKLELGKMLEHYRLTTAEIFYHMPDHPSLLQTFIWQELDINPDFPELRKFLDFWDRSLDGKVHSVDITHCDVISPSDVHFSDHEVYIQ